MINTKGTCSFFQDSTKSHIISGKEMTSNPSVMEWEIKEMRKRLRSAKTQEFIFCSIFLDLFWKEGKEDERQWRTWGSMITFSCFGDMKFSLNHFH